jgi:hypothetical protein
MAATVTTTTDTAESPSGSLSRWGKISRWVSKSLVGLSTLLIAKNVYDEANTLEKDQRQGKLAPRSPSPCDDPEVVQAMAMQGGACVDPDAAMGLMEGARRVIVEPVLEAGSRAAAYGKLTGVAHALDRAAKAELPVPNTYEARASIIGGEAIGGIGTYFFGEGELKLTVSVIAASNDLNTVFDLADQIHGRQDQTGQATQSGSHSGGHHTKLLGKKGEVGDKDYMAILMSDHGTYSIDVADPKDPRHTISTGDLNEGSLAIVRDAAKLDRQAVRDAIASSNGDTKGLLGRMTDIIAAKQANHSDVPGIIPSADSNLPRQSHGSNTSILKKESPTTTASAPKLQVGPPEIVARPTPNVSAGTHP